MNQPAVVTRWARHVLDAESAGTAVLPPSAAEGPSLTVEDAYDVQDAVIAAKVEQGERIVGAKLGLVSRAKQIAMGVDEPVFGWLTDAMAVPATQDLDLCELIHPRVEPEIAFVLRDQLAGPGVSGADVLQATEYVCAGLEVIDSRYRDFAFTLTDVIADNTSAAAFVLGERRVAPGDVDLPLVACTLRLDGEPMETATGAAVMGDPAEAVAMLANFLARRGGRLEPGWVVLSGGLTAPIALSPGATVSADLDTLGTVSVRATSTTQPKE